MRQPHLMTLRGTSKFTGNDGGLHQVNHDNFVDSVLIPGGLSLPPLPIIVYSQNKQTPLSEKFFSSFDISKWAEIGFFQV